MDHADHMGRIDRIDPYTFSEIVFFFSASHSYRSKRALIAIGTDPFFVFDLLLRTQTVDNLCGSFPPALPSSALPRPLRGAYAMAALRLRCRQSQYQRILLLLPP